MVWVNILSGFLDRRFQSDARCCTRHRSCLHANQTTSQMILLPILQIILAIRLDEAKSEPLRRISVANLCSEPLALPSPPLTAPLTASSAVPVAR